MYNHLQGISFGAPRYSNGASEKKNQRAEEVDLLEVCIFAARIIIKYRWLLLSTAVFCIVGGILWFVIAPPRYESALTCRVDGLDRSAVTRIVSAFANDVVARSEVAPGLKSLQVHEDQTASQTLVISAFVSNPDILPSLENMIVNYFQQNEYVRTATALETEKMNNTIQALREEEIRLAAVIEQTVSPENLQSDIYSVADVSKLKMDFYKERLALEARLRNYAPLTIIQRFSHVTVPVNKNLLNHILLSILAALLLGTMIIVVKEVRSIALGRKYRPLKTQK